MRLKRSILVFILCNTVALSAQKNDDSTNPYTDMANKIIDTALQDGQAYAMLRELCLEIGPRLSGSPQAAAAVEFCRNKMTEAGLENVHLQPVMVPHWVRGADEKASIVNSKTLGTVPLSVTALGGSIGTPELGITADVVEVQNFDDLKSLGENATGKIIFYNRAMDPRQRYTFQAYGGAVDQRSTGAIEAAKVGAVAVLVRSMTTRLDDEPHTGAMNYQDGVSKIPAAAISTIDANLLSDLLKKEDHIRLNLKLSCETLPDAPSANVIGELTGTDFPDEVVLLGGHLDSWDKGHGAHDDGAGCIQSIEALRLLKSMGLQPKRTIRAVMFMNEENGTRGAKAYAAAIAENGPQHIVAIESDRGGFTPRGLSVQTDPRSEVFLKVSRWAGLFESIGADRITPGYGGVDIAPLMETGTLTMGLVVGSHRYFDYHHSNNDTFDKVNERELQLGAAVMAIASYVLANEGL